LLKAGRKSSVSLLPYYGPGWYHRIAVEFLLHYARITWADITWSLSATGKIPPACLSEPLRVMEEAWGDETYLAKLSINSCIGLWAKDSHYVYHVKTSQDPVDGRGVRRICANQSNQSFLDCYCPMAEVAEEHRSSEVFRLGEGKPLQGFYEDPWKEATSPEPLPPWKELSKEEALQALLEGQGLLVLGPPGTGKTHWLRNAVASLRAAGKRVDVVAKTHAAVQNIGCHAKTADHYVRKYIRSGGLNCHALVVEELPSGDGERRHHCGHRGMRDGRYLWAGPG
jgi:hypothetical protein